MELLLLPFRQMRQFMNDQAISFQDIIDARSRIAGEVSDTPVLTSSTANRLAGADLFFKCENFQRVGAFKFRGAYNAVSRLNPADYPGGVVAFSSGNHAQAIALAASLRGMKACIVMPDDAPATKVAATRSYGAEIIWYDRQTGQRETIAAELAAARGAALIPAFDHPDVMAGQGTVALDFLGQVERLDALVVPVGGGGLLSGCAVAARALNPACRIIGVEPEAGNDAQLSLAAGRIVEIPTPATIADGAQTRRVGDLTFPIIRDLVDEILTVSDASLRGAMHFFAARMKIVVEPTGCLGAAAAFAGMMPPECKRVGIILSGGNVDLAQLGTAL